MKNMRTSLNTEQSSIRICMLLTLAFLLCFTNTAQSSVQGMVLRRLGDLEY